MRVWLHPGIMALILALALLGGCGSFGQGFRDEGLRQGANLAADAVADRLGGEFAELREGLEKIPGQIPDPPEQDSTGYALGALAAYIAGSILKGAYRKHQGTSG